MKVYVSRRSVAAGDDLDAPHKREFSFRDGTSLKEVLATIQKSYLPRIEGGNATWSVTSNIPVAVLAQQWAEPRLLVQLGDLTDLETKQGVLRLYFNYHAQIDPQLVYDVFWGFQLNAI